MDLAKVAMPHFVQNTSSRNIVKVLKCSCRSSLLGQFSCPFTPGIHLCENNFRGDSWPNLSRTFRSCNGKNWWLWTLLVFKKDWRTVTTIKSNRTTSYDLGQYHTYMIYIYIKINYIVYIIYIY